VDLIEQLKAGASNHKMVSWPGSDARIELHVLTEQDHFEAGIAADRIYADADLPITSANVDDYQAEKNTQLLFRAVRDPQSHKPLKCAVEDFRRMLTRDIRNALITELSQLEQECSPNPYTLSDEQYASVLEAVKKNAEPTVMSVSSIALLRRLSRSLASELAASQAGSGPT
jgi:hypothetical protein